MSQEAEMDDMMQEQVYLQKRDLMRECLKSSSKVGFADIARLTELDMRIAEMQSKRKYPLWTKFKNFGLFSINNDELKKRSLSFYGKMAWNIGFQTVKAVTAASLYPPVTLPLAAVYVGKRAFESDFYMVKNAKNYLPKCKGSWLRAAAWGTSLTSPGGLAFAKMKYENLQNPSKASFKPDDKDDILGRINQSKLESQVKQTETVAANIKPEQGKTKTAGKPATLSPEAAKKIMDSIFVR